jgi:hypothetical protein
MSAIFTFNDVKYKIYKDDDEPEELFKARAKFITMMKPKTQLEKNTAIKYSRIYVNVKFRRCVYSEEVMNKLKTFTNI